MEPSGLLTRAREAVAAETLTAALPAFLMPWMATLTLPGKNSRLGLSGNQVLVSREAALTATATSGGQHQPPDRALRGQLAPASAQCKFMRRKHLPRHPASRHRATCANPLFIARRLQTDG